MRNTCPKCNNALTVRDVIQNTCSKCTSLTRSDNVTGKVPASRSNIRADFDALISEELKKRTLKPAA
jgi:DNA-directed RNA polymerase subunit M/transcription elongation factor TFIIS